ncbi:hypothetical protein SAMN04489732_13316 [Amycolatopsis saalfeldensis]|uniref:Uncharacterized protein n=1 Tax=Amycolatopsis saalfeldensis TaxID=394193 RepID=A0A1H8YPI7_9PSEU|nr:hypothetical protein SAMN04489732_13316 [Amycolatopsis saalfeldensis]
MAWLAAIQQIGRVQHLALRRPAERVARPDVDQPGGDPADRDAGSSGEEAGGHSGSDSTTRSWSTRVAVGKELVLSTVWEMKVPSPNAISAHALSELTRLPG